MTVIGTRPEIIRLSEVIRACDKAFDHMLVHTGQNWDYNLNEIFFKDLGLREPNRYLKVVGADLGETMGNIISASYKLMSWNCCEPVSQNMPFSRFASQESLMALNSSGAYCISSMMTGGAYL